MITDEALAEWNRILWETNPDLEFVRGYDGN